MARWIATVHVQLDVDAETEAAARTQVRERLLTGGLRIAMTSPSEGVNGVRLDDPSDGVDDMRLDGAPGGVDGVRLDVPLAERVRRAHPDAAPGPVRLDRRAALLRTSLTYRSPGSRLAATVPHSQRVLGVALSPGQPYSLDGGVTWTARQIGVTPAQTMVRAAVDPIAGPDDPRLVPGARFVHTGLREPVPGVSEGDRPFMIMQITRVQGTRAWYRRALGTDERRFTAEHGELTSVVAGLLPSQADAVAAS